MKHAHITHNMVFGPVWKWRLYQKCAAIFIGNIWKTDDQPVHFGYTIFNETQLQSQSCLGSRRSPGGGSRNRFNHWTFLGGCTMDRPAQPRIYLGNRVCIHPQKSGFDHISSCYLGFTDAKNAQRWETFGAKKMVMGCFPAPSIAIVMSASDVVRKFISQPVDIDLILNIV